MLLVFTSDPGHYHEFLSVGAAWRGHYRDLFDTFFLQFSLIVADLGCLFRPGGCLWSPRLEILCFSYEKHRFAFNLHYFPREVVAFEA